MREIRPLTSLRGVFACWVMILHIFIAGLPNIVDPPWIVMKGYLAVDFFFFLSGFILAGTYGRSFAAAMSLTRYLNYIARRWSRLFPLHIAVVLAIIAFNPVYPLFREIEEITLTQRWRIWPVGVDDWINLPSWSVSTEWAASLLLPLFVIAGLRGPKIRAAVSGAFFAALLVYAAAAHQWNLNIWRSSVTILPMVRCFGDFGLGVIAFRFRDAAPALKSDRVLGVLIALWVAALALRLGDLAVIALMPPIVVGIAGNSGRIARGLSVGPLHWLGVISYSIYLTHYSFVLAFRFLLKGPASTPLQILAYGAAAIATTLAVSAVTYRWIEVPSRNWMKRQTAGVDHSVVTA